MNVTNATTRTSTSTSANNTSNLDPTILAKLDDILRRLKAGHKSAISDLKALNIKYTIKEQPNGDYIVNYYYQGQRYNVFFDFSDPSKSISKNPYANVSTGTTGSTSATNSTNSTNSTSSTSSTGTTNSSKSDVNTAGSTESKNGNDVVNKFLDNIENKGVQSNNVQNNVQNNKVNTNGVAQSAQLIHTALETVLEEKLDNIIDNNKVVKKLDNLKFENSSMHTEFGIDENGNIIFQEEQTQNVFNDLVAQITKSIKTLEMFGRYQNIINDLGGESSLKQLVQTAWITTYNTFDSSKSNDMEKFLKEVISNLDKIMQKLETNPEMLSMFTQRTSYADSNITDGVTHYGTETTAGNDETISYKGDVTVYDDGTVHIANNKDDNDYQTTMNQILGRLKTKYSSLGDDIVIPIFREAQKAALEAAKSNKADCPYGTGHKGGRVGDAENNWGGKDSRKGDDNKIRMDQLVQLTLYYFDKLLYQNLLN